MTLVLTLGDAEKALLIKAAYRYHEDLRDQRYKGLVRNTRLLAFAEVGSDILHMTMTPAGWLMAFDAAYKTHPIPYMRTIGRDSAQLLRSEWMADFIRTFNESIPA